MNGLMQILGGACLLVVLMTQMSVLRTALEVESDMTQADRRAAPAADFAAGLEIDGAKDGSRYKLGYMALASVGEMHDFRSVRAEFYVPFKELLDTGENPPDKDLLEAFVNARAARLAKAECDLLMRNLASQCVVDNSKASPSKQGLVRVNVSLDFVQKSEFGEVKAEKRAAYVEHHQSLTSQSSQTVTLSKSAEFRASLYERAAKLCDKLRAAEGNCAIYGVTISSRPNNSGGAQEVNAVATLSTISRL
jgi:hypothetical protein